MAVDTCLAACSAAVLRGEGESFARSERIGTGHAERIAPMVREVLEEAGLRASELTRLCVTVGPGSFMGARVGISLVKGLALPRRLPIVAISTLEALALGGARPITVLIDARRGQAYAQRFSGGPSEPAVLPYDEARRLVRPGDAVRGVGLAAILGRAAPEDVFPHPVRLAERALAAVPARPAPLYLREPDAKPQAASGVLPS
nr:tRNA (adenosine(37)-N6)-threonylcarbamoyltransferase complex dimerization subunit type 1 TsaB [Parvularcula dongshanensis]